MSSNVGFFRVDFHSSSCETRTSWIVPGLKLSDTRSSADLWQQWSLLRKLLRWTHMWITDFSVAEMSCMLDGNLKLLLFHTNHHELDTSSSQLEATIIANHCDVWKVRIPYWSEFRAKKNQHRGRTESRHSEPELFGSDFSPHCSKAVDDRRWRGAAGVITSFQLKIEPLGGWSFMVSSGLVQIWALLSDASPVEQRKNALVGWSQMSHGVGESCSLSCSQTVSYHIHVQ